MKKTVVMISVYHQNQSDVLLGNYFAFAEGDAVLTKNIEGFGDFELTHVIEPVSGESIRVHNLGHIIPTFGQRITRVFGTQPEPSSGDCQRASPVSSYIPLTY